jgi:hypothetical protein
MSVYVRRCVCVHSGGKWDVGICVVLGDNCVLLDCHHI